MTRRKHLVLPALTGAYIAFLLGLVNLNPSNRALLVTLLTLAYLAVNVIFDTKRRDLNLPRMLEISALVVLAQYLMLFAI